MAVSPLVVEAKGLERGGDLAAFVFTHRSTDMKLKFHRDK